MEAGIIVSFISAGIAFLSLRYTIKNSNRVDTEGLVKEAQERAALNIKLDNIARDTSESKVELKQIRADMQVQGMKIAELKAEQLQHEKRICDVEQTIMTMRIQHD